MKIITLWQPWASFISLGWKTIETRTHNRFQSLLNQTIGIHAGNKWDKDWMELARKYLNSNQLYYTQNEINFGFLSGMLRGKILCTGKIYTHRKLVRSDSEKALIDCTEGRYGLFIYDIKILTPPIAIKGHQGIWEHNS